MNRGSPAAWIFGLLALVLVSACSGFNQGLRKQTYPPTFNYISNEQLESTMWQLAAQAEALDRAMARVEAGGTPPREDVISILTAMEQTSVALGPGDWPSTHAQVSRNVEAFRRAVAAARRDVERDPSSYFRAGSVTGACTNCHEDG